eukprot:1639652-Prymnesium_polylepis.1
MSSLSHTITHARCDHKIGHASPTEAEKSLPPAHPHRAHACAHAVTCASEGGDGQGSGMHTRGGLSQHHDRRRAVGSLTLWVEPNFLPRLLPANGTCARSQKCVLAVCRRFECGFR